MSLSTKLATAAIAALTLGAIAVMPASQAQARHWGGAGIGFGIAAGAIIGAAAASNYGYGYYGPGYYRSGYDGPRCRFVRQFDGYGYYIGTTKICRY